MGRSCKESAPPDGELADTLIRRASGISEEKTASTKGSVVCIHGIHILYTILLTGGGIPWSCRSCSGKKTHLWRLGTPTIEFRWGVSFTMEKTGSLSDEPFRDCRDDAVLEGIASTGRLAPNRALSLCTEVKMTEVEFCAKFGRCSLSGLEVTAFLVFA